MPLSDIQKTVATDINLSDVQGRQDRLSQTRRLEYSEGVWTKAQSMDSKLSATVSHDSINECFKWYNRTAGREFVAKAGGLVATPYKAHGFDRRGLLTKPYHDAYIVDRDDLTVTTVDPFATVKQQLQYAHGRLTDRVILQAITDRVIVETTGKEEVQEDFSTAATRSDAKRHYTGQGMSLLRKDICFLPKSKATGNDSAKADLAFAGNTLDDFEEIMHVFRKRLKSGTKLYCTYTPDLQLRMRTNPQWKNAEDIYNGSQQQEASKSGMGFTYKNVTFVEINEDALPDLDAVDGITQATAGTGADKTATLRCRIMNNKDVKGKAAATLPAKASTAGAVVRDVEEVSKEDLVYFWEKDAVKFAKQGPAEIGETFDEVRLSMAKGMYSHVRLGGMLMDEDCVLVVPLRGKRVT